MIGKALQMYAEDLGFTVNDDCAYGIYEGYLITLYDTVNYKSCFINYYLSETDDADLEKKDALEEYVKENYETLKIDEYEIDINGISFSTKEGLINLSEIIKNIIDNLKSLDFCGSDTCSECGRKVEDGIIRKVSVDLNRYGLCEECTLAFLEANETKPETNNDENTDVTNKNKSWLSTLIVIICGSLAWILLSLFEVFGENNNLIIGVILSLILPVIHVRLYDLFGGEQGNKRLATVSVAIVIVAIISNYIVSVGSAYSDLGITDWATIVNSLKYSLVEPLEIDQSFFSIPFYKNTIVSILVAFIGIVLFVTDFLKPKTQNNKDIKID